jgi:type III pantothenate kinase
MTLLVDIGNSRVKWAQLRPDGTLEAQSAAAYAGWSVRDWSDSLFGDRPVGRVLAASVAGDSVDARLLAAAKLAGDAGVRFVATTREAAGVRNGYADPALLGVDRWVAAIGGYAHARGACVVADVGTAATIDVVGADGRHLGGYIVPGPELMVASLLRSTSELGGRHAASCESVSDAGFADNTRDAIEGGCRLALAALVDRCVMDAAVAVGEGPRLLLTGGAAADVLPHLRSPAEHIPDLVLRGLAVLAGKAT